MANGLRLTFVVCMVVVMLFGCSSGDTFTTLPWKDTHVYLQNEIQGNKDLNVHCHSKDDDIGWRKIVPGGTYDLKFRPSLRSFTVWKCHIFWINDQKVHMTVSDISLYDYGTSTSNCYKCFWVARMDGLFRRSNPQDWGGLIFDWRKVSYPHKAEQQQETAAAAALEQQSLAQTESTATAAATTKSTTTSDMTNQGKEEESSKTSVTLLSAAESKSLLTKEGKDPS